MVDYLWHSKEDIKEKKMKKNVVVTKAHGVRMKDITIREKTDGKSRGVSFLIKPKDAQGKTSRTFILCDIITIVDNNKVFLSLITNTPIILKVIHLRVSKRDTNISWALI